MSKKIRLARTVLISRQESTMASSWNEHLCIEAVSGKKFQLATCTREWIGPIHTLRGKSKLFDSDGNLVVPEFWGKKRIVGIADMEYLETENLVVNDDSEVSVPFNADNIIDARTYCEEQGWTSNDGFDEAWMKIETLVKSLDNKATAHKNSDIAEYQLLSRQEETSPYDEYLYLVNTGAGDFELQKRVHDSVGPIQSIPQKNKFFNSKGNRIKPKTFEGSKILGYVDLDGLGDDNSYAFLERIVQTPLDQDVIRFRASEIADVKQFCVANRWSSCDGFRDAWKKLKAIVKSAKEANAPFLTSYLKSMGIRGSNRPDGLKFLAAREESSMSSVWTNILALEHIEGHIFRLHQGQLEIVGSVYDLLDSDSMYNEAGEIIVPRRYKGVKVIGLEDNEFLKIDKFYSENTSEQFNSSDMPIWNNFLRANGWLGGKDSSNTMSRLKAAFHKQTKL